MGTERFNVIIPKYPEVIQTSNQARPKFFTRLDKLPLMYRDESRYVWVKYSKKVSGTRQETFVDYLTDLTTKERVVKNNKIAGKPRFTKINGQMLWSSGSGMEFYREKLKDQLTAFFTPFIIRQLGENRKIFAPANHFIQLEFIFYYPLISSNVIQDIDNHSVPYTKTFIDTLQMIGVIPKDDPEIVRGCYSRYVNIADPHERRIEVKFHFCKNGEPISH